MNGKFIGDGSSPLICTPLVGRTRDALLSELDSVLPKGPDAVEWRADYFEELKDKAAVVALGRDLERIADGRSVIFTIRSEREGGQPTGLSDGEALEIDEAICRETSIEYVDCELRCAPGDIRRLREVARQHGTKVIGSFHDFARTPSRRAIVRKLREAERRGLDVAKVAVMPASLDDVLTLLAATVEAKRRLSIPLITMSMGAYGAATRLMGGLFGSSLSFAVGSSASAPGQVPIDDLRAALEIIERSRD